MKYNSVVLGSWSSATQQIANLDSTSASSATIGLVCTGKLEHHTTATQLHCENISTFLLTNEYNMLKLVSTYIVTILSLALPILCSALSKLNLQLSLCSTMPTVPRLLNSTAVPVLNYADCPKALEQYSCPCAQLCLQSHGSWAVQLSLCSTMPTVPWLLSSTAVPVLNNASPPMALEQYSCPCAQQCLLSLCMLPMKVQCIVITVFWGALK
jgi:hypothetical protein